MSAVMSCVGVAKTVDQFETQAESQQITVDQYETQAENQQDTADQYHTQQPHRRSRAKRSRFVHTCTGAKPYKPSSRSVLRHEQKHSRSVPRPKTYRHKAIQAILLIRCPLLLLLPLVHVHPPPLAVALWYHHTHTSVPDSAYEARSTLSSQYQTARSR
eukprot:1933176-Rhodomonas_salina.1